METDPDLTGWITALENNCYRIGLFDLGDPHLTRDDYSAAKKRREATIKGKHRFEKNFTDKAQWKATELTPDFIQWWLSADMTYAAAQRNVNYLEAQLKIDLAKWVRTAFWRRTSKLGIDFTTGRGETIHFNTAADRKWNPTKGGTPTMRAGDLARINDSKAKYGRMITTSEYRHATKKVASGDIPAHLVNFYDEF
jgi:hypothetical protein